MALFNVRAIADIRSSHVTRRTRPASRGLFVSCIRGVYGRANNGALNFVYELAGYRA